MTEDKKRKRTPKKFILQRLAESLDDTWMDCVKTYSDMAAAERDIKNQAQGVYRPVTVFDKSPLAVRAETQVVKTVEPVSELHEPQETHEQAATEE